MNILYQWRIRTELVLSALLCLSLFSLSDIRQMAFTRLSMLFQYEEIQSPEDLVALHLEQIYSYLPIVPPGVEEMVHPYGSSVVPFQPEQFPKAFQSQLVGEWNSSRTAPAYKLWLHNQKRNLVAYNADGLEIARFPLPRNYDPRWLFKERYPNGFPESFDQSMRKSLRNSLNPSVIVTEITMVPSQYLYAWLIEEEEQNTLLAQNRMASQSLLGGGGAMIMMMSSTEEIKIDSMTPVTNGVELSFLSTFTNATTWDLFYYDGDAPNPTYNGTENVWSLMETNFVLTNGMAETWVDTSYGTTPRFYALGNANDLDSDNLRAGEEFFVYHTKANDADTDDDGVDDGDEVLIFGTDPVNTHNSPLPYTADFESTNGYSLATLNGQNGWVTDEGISVLEGVSHSGTQSVEFEALDQTASKFFAVTNNVITNSLFVYLGPQFSVPTNLPALSSSLVSYESGTGLQAFDGNGSGGGSWSTASGTTDLRHQWVELEIVQDYSSQIWSLYVDGVLKLSSLGFKDNSITQLMAMHLRSGIGGGVRGDDVRVD